MLTWKVVVMVGTKQLFLTHVAMKCLIHSGELIHYKGLSILLRKVIGVNYFDKMVHVNEYINKKIL